MRHCALIMAVVGSVCWLVLGCESQPEFTDPGARLEYRNTQEARRRIQVLQSQGIFWTVVGFFGIQLKRQTSRHTWN